MSAQSTFFCISYPIALRSLIPFLVSSTQKLELEVSFDRGQVPNVLEPKIDVVILENEHEPLEENLLQVNLIDITHCSHLAHLHLPLKPTTVVNIILVIYYNYNCYSKI